MKAQPIFNRRVSVADGVFAELAIWRLPQPVPGSSHDYKYRLALVAEDRGVVRCVVRYDNETGKGDHRHLENAELPYVFIDVDVLVADFFNDVTRWRNERGDD